MSLEFFMLPVPVALRRDLTPAGKLVYADILTRSGPHGFCRAGRARLAQDLGLRPATVSTSIARLEAAKLIAVERRGRGRVNFCRVLSSTGTENVPLPSPAESRVRKPDAAGTQSVPELVRKPDAKRKEEYEKKSAAALAALPGGGSGPPWATAERQCEDHTGSDNSAATVAAALSKRPKSPPVKLSHAKTKAEAQRQIRELEEHRKEVASGHVQVAQGSTDSLTECEK